MTAFRLAFVVAEFNREIMDAMVASATAEAGARSADIVHSVRVPGCYEVPRVTQALLTSKDVDGVVVLGYIERGETQHGEVMGQVVHSALVQLSLGYNKPIGIGIIGPGATIEQARTRKEAYAKNAVAAVIAGQAATLAARSVAQPQRRGFRAS